MIKITLEFRESDLNDILAAANFTDKPSLKVKDLTKKQIAALKKELQATAGTFVSELVDGSREACANDWLAGWGPQDGRDD